MKLLFVSALDRCVRSAATIVKYVEIGRRLGHEVSVYGEPHGQFPSLPFTLDAANFDRVLFVVHIPSDFPDMPCLARLLDSVPRERRVIIDCWGRLNDTIRVEHDFNHLEKLDGHLGWEWIDAFQAVSATILQPTLAPRRSDARSFLFHGFDPAAVRPGQVYAKDKPYGVMYVGNNWQRWDQVRRFLDDTQGIQEQLGKICLVGWDWDRRPDWAVQLGLQGVDVDANLLAVRRVETRGAVPYTDVVGLLSQARFSPIFYRPLFRELGCVTNRVFETFCAATLPLVFLPEEFAAAIYGPAVRKLIPRNVAEYLQDVMRDPEPYAAAVAAVREHLAGHHSFEQRFRELLAILNA